MWLELTNSENELVLVNMDRVVLVTGEVEGCRLHVSLPESRAHNGITLLVRETQAAIRERLLDPSQREVGHA